MSEVKVPEGYKQTEVGIIPKDWEATTIGSVTSWLSGGTPSRSNSDFWNGSIPWISGSTLKTLEIYTSDQFLTAQGVESGSKMAPLDSTLLLVRGSALHKFIRAGLVVAPVCFNQDVKALIPNGSINPKYLTIYILAMESELLDLVSSAGNSAGVLDTELVQSFKLLLPPKQEQTAIATALSDVDNLIGSLEKLIAKKEAIKTGTMQQLLTGKTRLPEFASRENGSAKGFKQTELGQIPEDWEVIEFGKLLKEFRNGYSFSAKGYIKNGTPIITMSQIGLNGSFQYNPNEVKKWDTSQFEHLKDFWVKDGDLLIAMTDVTPDKNLIGQMTIAELTHTALLNQRVGLLRLNKDLAQSNYLRYLSSLPLWRTYCKGVASLGVQANIGTKEIKQASVTLPLVEEQTAIATILSDMDAEIQTLQERLNKTRDIKQGMMQQLLTGKVRLVH